MSAQPNPKPNAANEKHPPRGCTLRKRVTDASSNGVKNANAAQVVHHQKIGTKAKMGAETLDTTTLASAANVAAWRVGIEIPHNKRANVGATNTRKRQRIGAKRGETWNAGGFNSRRRYNPPKGGINKHHFLIY